MKLKTQILMEVIVGLSVFVIVAILIFVLFVIASKGLKYSEEAFVSYNLSSNYSFILLGISREKFSKLDLLEENIDYYLSPSSSGYEIKEGKELIQMPSGIYYVWFRIKNKALESNPSLKLLSIFIQTPSTLFSYPLILSNLKEKTIFQDIWTEATSSIITITPTTSLIYYSTKSPHINIDGEVYLP